MKFSVVFLMLAKVLLIALEKASCCPTFAFAFAFTLPPKLGPFCKPGIWKLKSREKENPLQNV